MTDQKADTLHQRKILEKNHPIASNTYVSSPCGRFKIRCKVNSMSYAGYEIAVLYHQPDIGEKYDIGQEVTLHHEKEKWSRVIAVTSRKGNLIDSEIINPITTISVMADDGTQTSYVCEFLGYYCDLYRISFHDFSLLNGDLSLQLPNGEDLMVRLRWRNETEICLQAVGTRKVRPSLARRGA